MGARHNVGLALWEPGACVLRAPEAGSRPEGWSRFSALFWRPCGTRERVVNVCTFTIERTWQGQPLTREEQVTLLATVESEHAELSWDAPWPIGPVPEQPPGQCWGLWEYSVVELFLASAEGPYVEFEFGPGGHWLALYLTSYRQIGAVLSGVQYRGWREGPRWRGQACVPLPESHRWQSGNAYFIDGHSGERRYCAASSVHDVAPDFHRRDCYLTL